jgi:hypothetical protein
MTSALYAAGAIWAGVAATLATDLWQRLLQAAAGLPAPPWGLVGRWVAWMPRGVFAHRSIAATPPVRGERALGWAFHYAVGVVYAALYLGLMRWLNVAPTLPSALVFSLALLVAPWLVMQPALGLGLFASKAPRPNVARAVSVSAHAVFGLGLYVGLLASPF